jgi:hypothetical protein
MIAVAAVHACAELSYAAQGRTGGELRSPFRNQPGDSMASIKKKAQHSTPKKGPEEAGNRPGRKGSSGKKPSATNLSIGGGSAANKKSTGASGARGKGARST